MSNYIGLETYLSDKKLFEHLSQICDYLGRSNAARLLIDELLTNIYLQQKHNRCEIMFLINLILHGVSEKNPKTESKNDIYSIINIVLASFINDSQQFESNNIEIESITAADNDNETHFKSSITIERNRKILQTCLVIEAISMSSKCLDRNNFDYFLIDTLYFCLENYLNNNLLIRVAANKCLESLTTNLNYKSIQELLSINYDYIMNDLVLKSHKQIRLKNKENDEATLESHVYVLCSLLDIANVDIVPYLERLVDDYFVSIELNSMDHTIIIGICNIMLHMSRSMRKWYPEVDLKFMNQDNAGEKFLSNLNLKSLVKSKQKPDYYRSFKDTLIEIEESINEFKMKQEETSETSNIESSIDQLVKENEEEMEKIGDEQIEKEQADNKQVQLHIKLQCKCMQLCMHLISHPYKQIRLSIIELIGELSRNLAGHTNEFLPLAHKLWMPICQRFSFDDFIVKSKIIYLLFDLSVYCNDFLASRFCKEFLPRLCKFMQEQSTLSLKSTKDATYIYSHAFKLQCAILSNLDKMCILYDIKEMELENVLTTSIFSYLDKRQPKKLQLLALNSIQNCSLIDPDLVWLCLHYILPFASLNNSIKLVHSKNIKLKSDYQFSNEILEGLIQVYRNLLYSYLKQSE
jgi:TELO2-interacting protein 1